MTFVIFRLTRVGAYLIKQCIHLSPCRCSVPLSVFLFPIIMNCTSLRQLYRLLFAVCAFATVPAHAEEVFNFVQMTCIPEFNYFSFRTMAVSRDPSTEANVDELAIVEKRLESRDQVFPADSLLEQPYECNLAAHNVSVRANNTSPRQKDGKCPSCKNFNIEIRLGMKLVASFPAHRQTILETHSLELNQDFLEDCEFADYENRKLCATTHLLSTRKDN